MLVFGALLRVLEPVAIIAASLTSKSIFNVAMDRRSDADLDRRFLGSERQSDHYAILQAYKGWENACKTGYERTYCDSHHLSAQTLNLVKRTKTQFIQTLVQCGFVQSIGGEGENKIPDPAVDTYSDNFGMVTAALQCGLFPNFLWIKGGRKAGVGIRQKLFTTDHQLVRMHPSSVNSDHLWGDFVVYFERMRNTNQQVYIIDSSVVNPLPTVLFAGDLALTDVNKKETHLLVNEWMTMSVRNKTAKHLHELHALFTRYLHTATTTNNFKAIPDSLLSLMVTLVKSQEAQEVQRTQEEVGGAVFSSATSGVAGAARMAQQGGGQQGWQGRGRGGPGYRGGYNSRGGFGGGGGYNDPFANAQMTRMQLQTGGWGQRGRAATHSHGNSYNNAYGSQQGHQGGGSWGHHHQPHHQHAHQHGQQGWGQPQPHPGWSGQQNNSGHGPGRWY
eukprot:TRINITY_DN12106_c0_g1_i1.p1 TRINITY_DN12106_c0_g1~~TRINITY_DN12106_c0_g1_i1.p1  ORF type:complete len:446 (-),score=34.60 TRINITY_DN12106_c0_g1_i1:775-2112(-)